MDILINNAARSIRRPLAESLERWHDVERTMVLNYYAPLRLIRGFAPGMLERGDGHIINVTTWGVLSEAAPLFSVYNASKAALSAVSRIGETEWGPKGVHSTTLYYPLVATPMIAPTKAYDGMPAADAGRGRRLDGHRRPDPAGADRAADGDRGQGAGHHRPPLGEHAHAAARRPTRQASRTRDELCLISDDHRGRARALASDLVDLTPAQWETRSLCTQWSVHDIVAHMSATASMSTAKFFVGTAKTGFNFDKFADGQVGKHRGPDPATTLNEFRSVQHSTSAPPGPTLPGSAKW